MAISPVSGSGTSQDVDRAVAVMKKTRDVEKTTADSLAQLVKDAAPQKSGRIDTYA